MEAVVEKARERAREGERRRWMAAVGETAREGAAVEARTVVIREPPCGPGTCTPRNSATVAAA